MQILFEVLQRLVLVKLFLQKVLNGFDVVVCYLFNFFNSIPISYAEFVENKIEPVILTLDTPLGLFVS